MPRAIAQKPNAAIAEALSGAVIRKQFGERGSQAKSSTPEAFGELPMAETRRWRALPVNSRRVSRLS